MDAVHRSIPRDTTPPSPDFGEALRYWWKLGWISFGGPAGQIAIMHHELVERRRWISEGRFLHALNYCMVLPGPEAQQLATYIGWLMHRTWGGIAAGALFVLPSLAVLVVLSWLYMAYGHVPAIAGILYGIKPAVTAIVLHAAWRIGSRALKSPPLWAIAAAAFVAIYVFAVPFPAIVLAAGLLGAIGGRVAPAQFAAGGAHKGGDAGYGPAVIDDATPTPAYARFSATRLTLVIGSGVALWAGTLALLAWISGLTGALTQMGWFFTKAALITFGGAYAVLPYVVQGAVETYGWLTTPQMIDGLALGETTPGPLIMVVAFVGFVGGWTKQLFGSDQLFAAGAAAAAVATWFTFLPSFVFILAGGPLVESTHGQLRFTAPLTGITAAVVGVIVNLAVFFALHVLWPAGLHGPFDWISALIGLGAIAALFRWKAGVIPVIAACAAAGFAVTLLRGA
ncbi:MAG TPA: chromate efflux transporter [Casimicrobiaceae bacterium]|nr:chromate efflux transporter [Casimicrobiaceae bacterium]